MFGRWLRNNFWRSMLAGYHWYRKWYGGVWELWEVGVPVNKAGWHDVKAPWFETRQRPSVICIGAPMMTEDYR